jgi:hypothetical protein
MLFRMIVSFEIAHACCRVHFQPNSSRVALFREQQVKTAWHVRHLHANRNRFEREASAIAEPTAAIICRRDSIDLPEQRSPLIISETFS